MKSTRIGIVDDHAIFRQGLRKLFDDYSEFCVVGEASNGVEAMLTVSNRVELVLFANRNELTSQNPFLAPQVCKSKKSRTTGSS